MINKENKENLIIDPIEEYFEYKPKSTRPSSCNNSKRIKEMNVCECLSVSESISVCETYATRGRIKCFCESI